MAKEYIERELVLRQLTSSYNRVHDGKTLVHPMAAVAFRVVRHTPAADVVEVVRCKDCKYFGTEICALDTYLFEVTEDGFCNYGERRGNNA